jgi:DNA primase
VPRQSESVLAAIKQAVDLVALVGEYLPVHRSGSKFKGLCPFHDDHNPSLELNPERQSFKCWSCGAGGDVFDFVQRYERVEFPEALRMLAERAGIQLEASTERSATAPAGPSRADLLATAAWARDQFAAALPGPAEAMGYVRKRGVAEASVRRFHLGYAPDQRDWLQGRARRAGLGLDVLEQVGLIARSPETGVTRDRFRGRLIFPIHDGRGRAIGFGGRVLPETEAKLAEQGQRVAKYLNSPETPLFQKRRTLYAADLARDAARKAGWVAVVEGYTDVIAAHQAGIENVVGTLGTALGDDHVTLLRRLADRVVLVFDGDEAGQKAADRSLELFLGHAVDVRVLTLPSGLDPCDFLMAEGGGGAFRDLVDRAVDPLEFAIERAAGRFDLDSPEGARQASEWVLGLLARMPARSQTGLELKLAKALSTLSERLGVTLSNLKRGLQLVQQAGRHPRPVDAGSIAPEPAPPRIADLDPMDRELVTLALSEPAVISALRTKFPTDLLREPSLRVILQTGYDLEAEDLDPTYDRIMVRLEDPGLRALVAGLALPIEPGPLVDGTVPAPVEQRLSGVMARLAERNRRQRLRDLQAAKAEIDPLADPDTHRALQREYLRVLNQRPD